MPFLCIAAIPKTFLLLVDTAGTYTPETICELPFYARIYKKSNLVDKKNWIQLQEIHLVKLVSISPSQPRCSFTIRILETSVTFFKV